MKLSREQETKVDQPLLESLSHEGGDRLIRVIMTLRADDTEDQSAQGPEDVQPSKYGSRESYRAALIERQRKLMALQLEQTRHSLESLALCVRGGKLGRTVVVEGSAKQIASSLELPGVERVRLDIEIGLIEPRRGLRADSD